jgi:hypothetical protein
VGDRQTTIPRIFDLFDEERRRFRGGFSKKTESARGL